MKERENRIEFIIKALKKHKKKINIKEFVFEIADVFKCSQRTASEYIRCAKWKMENENN